MRKLILSILVLFLILIILPEAVAQCPMCRMSVESNLQQGGTAGKGLNAGILYMLAMPYLLVGTIGYIWYRNRINSQNDYPPVGHDQLN
ncbi:MAG: hypothetical protein KDC57_19490 [Saprospiraceae bacterium]|nr:hypothetical protein [Saprospiraceae bacterium]